MPAASASVASAPPDAAPIEDNNACVGTWCKTIDDLVDVVAVSPSDVWIVEHAHGILHWDGKTYDRTMLKHAASAIARVAADDLWATTNDGLLLHSNGKTWTEVDAGNNELLTSIWAASASDIWVVGHGGTILHGDGKTWTHTRSPTKEPLYRVRGRGPKEVWAAGAKVVLRWDGSTWSVATRVGPGAKVEKLPADPHTAFRVHGHNEALSEMDALAPIGPKDVWAGAAYGRMLHFDGASWREVGIRDQSTGAMWASAANDVWAVGTGIAHFDGRKWTDTPRGAHEVLTAISGTSASDVWTVGEGAAILHFDGKAWTNVNPH